MLPRPKLRRRGQYRDEHPRRRRPRAIGVEGLESRALLSFGVISTVAGDNSFGYTGNGGPATSAELNNPSGVAFDSAGELFIADTDNNVIREVVESSTTASALHVNCRGARGNSSRIGPQPIKTSCRIHGIRRAPASPCRQSQGWNEKRSPE
jgi:hypothetical protein